MTVCVMYGRLHNSCENTWGLYTWLQHGECCATNLCTLYTYRYRLYVCVYMYVCNCVLITSLDYCTLFILSILYVYKASQNIIYHPVCTHCTGLHICGGPDRNRYYVGNYTTE